MDRDGGGHRLAVVEPQREIDKRPEFGIAGRYDPHHSGGKHGIEVDRFALARVLAGTPSPDVERLGPNQIDDRDGGGVGPQNGLHLAGRVEVDHDARVEQGHTRRPKGSRHRGPTS